MSIKLNGTLPRGEANGLGPMAAAMIADPSRYRVVLAIVDCKSITTDADTGDTIPTARIRRAEVVLDKDLRLARELMARSLENRTGRVMLPVGLEDELRAAFDTADHDD